MTRHIGAQEIGRVRGRELGGGAGETGREFANAVAEAVSGHAPVADIEGVKHGLVSDGVRNPQFMQTETERIESGEKKAQGARSDLEIDIIRRITHEKCR